jgi:hypothetical protein
VLAYPIGSCLTGAGLALLAVTRVWSVQLTARPGLSDLRVVRTGGALAPWLPALALVGLAGVGALLATRGSARRVVGALVVAVGAGLTVGAGVTRAGLDPGAAGVGGTLWPVAAALGGMLVVAGGFRAVRAGHRWPAMGTRYDRAGPDRAGPDRAGAAPAGTPAGDAPVDQQSDAERSAADRQRGSDGQRRRAEPVDTRAAWDALDRGDDPTLG